MVRATAALALAVVISGCASGPESLFRKHAYDGPRKPNDELATVFARWDIARGEQTFICTVDGKSYRQGGERGVCASVVYVGPEAHVLWVEHHAGFRVSGILLTLNPVAGRTYLVTGTVHDSKYMRFDLREMPPSFVLTYRDLAPGLFAKGDRPNRPVDPADAD
jgi:hypothetical protein